MAKSATFYRQNLDRTNYTGCYLLAVLFLALFLAASGFFWWLAGKVKIGWHLGSSPSLSLPSANTDLVNQVQDSLQQKAQDAVNQEKKQAEDAAKAAAQQEVQTQASAAADNLKNSIKNNLQQ